MTHPLTQDTLDRMAEDRSRSNYRSRLTRATKHGTETDLAPVRRLLAEGVEKTSEALAAWIKDETPEEGAACRPSHLRAPLTYLKPDQIALISVQTVLDQISRPRSYLSVAYAIGKAIEEESKFGLIEKEYPESWKDIVRERDLRTNSTSRMARKDALWGIIRGEYDHVLSAWDDWSRRVRYRVGTLMLELMRTSTGIIQADRVPNMPTSKGVVHYHFEISLTQEASEWLAQRHADAELLHPYYMPMAHVPHDWTSPWQGGYPGNALARLPLFRVKRRHLDRMGVEDMPRVYEAVNHIQGTSWRINEDVRQVADYVWREMGGGVAGLPDLDPEELPTSPSDQDFRENTQAAKDWKRAAAAVHGRNRRSLAKRLLSAKILQEADLFQHQPFWYPHKYDFRGRVYPIASTGLSPQGTDLSKGLLEFADALPIKDDQAEAWLYIHGANCFGVSKVPFAERLEWVKANATMIRAVSEDPFGAPAWCDAEEPFQFLAWCFDVCAYWDAQAAGEVYHSRLPVAMDGSNNGLQLYALLARDPVCAESTNVSPGDSPRDIYQDVADVVTANLRAAAAGEDLELWTSKNIPADSVQNFAKDWLAFVGGRVPRSLSKRPVMVLPYGGTPYSAQVYCNDWYDDEIKGRGLIDNRPFAHAYMHVVVLARMVWAAIGDLVKAPVELMGWLQDVSDEMTKAGLDIAWTTPTGFRVHQAAFTDKRTTISVKIGGSITKRRGKVRTDKLCSRGQRNGIAPNFIHALDASVLTETMLLLKAQGVRDVGVVHDSFATHAANAQILASSLREAVYRVFLKDPLGDFKRECEQRLGRTLPDPPASGTLVLDCVKQSLYFYS